MESYEVLHEIFIALYGVDSFHCISVQLSGVAVGKI
jgi:hypothetical protein